MFYIFQISYIEKLNEHLQFYKNVCIYVFNTFSFIFL